MTTIDYSKQVPAADRTLTLLEVLSNAPDGLTSSELLTELDGSRSGLYALLNTLKARHYVVSEEGRHRLGPALWSLTPQRPETMDHLIEGFRSVTAGQSPDETTAVTWPDGDGTMVIAQAQSDRPVRVVYRTGSRRGPERADSQVLAAGGSGDDPGLRSIRRTGLATSAAAETVEVAAPVCGDGIRPVASVLAGVPIHRADEEALAAVGDRLRHLAVRLSYHLGASTYQPYGWVSGAEVGPSRELTDVELDEFLDGLWGAQLACVRSDGTPHVVPLWYEWDGAAMWMAASPGASWSNYICDNPQVSVTLDEPWPPLRRVFLSGIARTTESDSVPGGLEGLRRRLANRYLGQGADRRPELTEVEGWAAVRIEPDRIHGRQGLGMTALGDSR